MESESRRLMQRQLQNIEWFAIRFGSILVLCILAFGYAVGGHASVGDKGKSLYVIAVFLAISGAGVVGGGLLGFLFGIPRFLRQGDDKTTQAPTPPAQSQPIGNAPRAAGSLRSFAGNTNLEEISDWLTKIFVGISLVQAKGIYKALETLADSFQKGAFNDLPAAGAFFVAIGLSSTIGGFLFFYLETRTRITLLLSDADVAAVPPASEDRGVLKESLQTPIPTPAEDPSKGLRGADTESASSVEADAKLRAVPFEDLKTADAFAAWAGAQARANNDHAAGRAIQEAILRDPSNAQYLRMLADIRFKLGDARQAVAAYAEARAKNPTDPALLRQELLAALYMPPPDSFDHALKIADQLAELQPDSACDPVILVWRAAAYGQQFAWLTKNNGASEAKARARDAALKLAREIVHLQPDPSGAGRQLLRLIFDPAAGGEATGNDDLHVFFDDPEFKEVILGATAPASPPSRLGDTEQAPDTNG